MSEVKILQPHDPLPAPSPHHLLLVRRFADNQPDRVVSEITVTADGEERSAFAEAAGGGDVGFDAALEQAKALARRLGVRAIYAVDRTAGPLESQVKEQRGHRGVEAPLEDNIGTERAVVEAKAEFAGPDGTSPKTEGPG